MEIWGKQIQCVILVKREKIGTVWKLGNIGTVMNKEEKGRECCAGTLPLSKQNQMKRIRPLVHNHVPIITVTA